MKQVDLAAAMGADYTQSAIAHVEAGHRGLSFARAMDAARALGVSLDYLAGLTDDHRPAAELSRLLLAHGGLPAPPLVAQAKGGRR